MTDIDQIKALLEEAEARKNYSEWEDGFTEGLKTAYEEAMAILNKEGGLEKETADKDAKINTLLDWCNGNIESGSEVAAYSLQIRRLFEA